MINLTSHEQNFFAELCQILRKRAENTKTALMPRQLVDRIDETICRFDMAPQDLDRLYDIMHRSGANC